MEASGGWTCLEDRANEGNDCSELMTTVGISGWQRWAWFGNITYEIKERLKSLSRANSTSTRERSPDGRPDPFRANAKASV